MGYTHYWRRPAAIDPAVFRLIAADFRRLATVLAKHGVPLAGSMGTGKLLISSAKIAFNGPEKCGHPPNAAVSIPWPSPNAGGLAPSAQALDGGWWAGASLDARTCNGDCSYESFVFPRVFKPESWERLDENGRYFACCKTAFRPYDIAVTACLIVAKHHLGDAVEVRSDGEDGHWFDAKMLCQSELGYGLELAIAEGELCPSQEVPA